jgi:hypothetical protein
MSYESMSLIEGKIKLPFLQGEHSSDIQHFREMENSMAHNLNNWLCNGYLEVSLPLCKNHTYLFC